MKEELLQLKQDIIDISNDLKTNLADKGITADGTLSELVDRVPDIEGNTLGEIGWNLLEQPFLKDAIEYAKEILKNPKSKYSDDKQLVIFPKVEELILKASMFARSNMILFPEGVKLTGASNSCFSDTPIISIDLTGIYGITNYTYMFQNCKHLNEVKVAQDFGKGVTSFYLTFQFCESLKKIDYIDTSSATTTGGLFLECVLLESVPALDITNSTNVIDMFKNCRSLKSIILKGDPSKLISTDGAFEDCSSLIYLSIPDNFPIIAKSYDYGIIKSIQVPKIYGSFDYTKCECYGNSYYLWVTGFTENKYTRYMVIKNLGYYKSGSYLNMEYSRVWGIANDEVLDARQSLIDSLITYSFDRATAGYPTMTMKLYPNVKALLTDDEIAQITAKGYTLV